MLKKKPSKDLEIALESEIYGEASFRAAYYACLSPRLKIKAETLLKLETQTKYRLLEYFNSNGLSVPKKRAFAIKGTILGLLFPVVPWSLVLKILIRETDHFLEVFNRLEQQAPEKDKPFFQYIVAHEKAIRSFAEIELHNNKSDSLNPVKALL